MAEYYYNQNGDKLPLEKIPGMYAFECDSRLLVSVMSVLQNARVQSEPPPLGLQNTQIIRSSQPLESLYSLIGKNTHFMTQVYQDTDALLIVKNCIYVYGSIPSKSLICEKYNLRFIGSNPTLKIFAAHKPHGEAVVEIANALTEREHANASPFIRSYSTKRNI